MPGMLWLPCAIPAAADYPIGIQVNHCDGRIEHTVCEPGSVIHLMWLPKPRAPLRACAREFVPRKAPSPQPTEAPSADESTEEPTEEHSQTAEEHSESADESPAPAEEPPAPAKESPAPRDLFSPVVHTARAVLRWRQLVKTKRAKRHLLAKQFRALRSALRARREGLRVLRRAVRRRALKKHVDAQRLSALKWFSNAYTVYRRILLGIAFRYRLITADLSRITGDSKGAWSNIRVLTEDCFDILNARAPFLDETVFCQYLPMQFEADLERFLAHAPVKFDMLHPDVCAVFIQLPSLVLPVIINLVHSMHRLWDLFGHLHRLNAEIPTRDACIDFVIANPPQLQDKFVSHLMAKLQQSDILREIGPRWSNFHERIKDPRNWLDMTTKPARAFVKVIYRYSHEEFMRKSVEVVHRPFVLGNSIRQFLTTVRAASILDTVEQNKPGASKLRLQAAIKRKQQQRRGKA